MWTVMMMMMMCNTQSENSPQCTHREMHKHNPDVSVRKRRSRRRRLDAQCVFFICWQGLKSWHMGLSRSEEGNRKWQRFMCSGGGALVQDVLWGILRGQKVDFLGWLMWRWGQRRSQFTSWRGVGGAGRGGQTGRRSGRTQCSGKVWFLCACGNVGSAHQNAQNAKCSPPRYSGRVSLLRRGGRWGGELRESKGQEEVTY